MLNWQSHVVELNRVGKFGFIDWIIVGRLRIGWWKDVDY